jgi:hypothetical protein
MKEVYEEMVQLLLTSTIFTNVFNDRLDAVYARENTVFPFAVYTPQPTNKITKDADEFSINLGFYFGADQLTECVEFYDAFKNVIENSDFINDIISPEFDYELQVNQILINLKKIK